MSRLHPVCRCEFIRTCMMFSTFRRGSTRSWRYSSSNLAISSPSPMSSLRNAARWSRGIPCSLANKRSGLSASIAVLANCVEKQGSKVVQFLLAHSMQHPKRGQCRRSSPGHVPKRSVTEHNIRRHISAACLFATQHAQFVEESLIDTGPGGGTLGAIFGCLRHRGLGQTRNDFAAQ